MRHASLIALRNRTEEALEQYGAVAAQAQDIGGVPQFATLALVNQSDLLLALGRADESAAVAREGLRLGDIIPTSEATRDFLVGNLAEALIDLGDLEGAQAALEDRLRVDRGNPQRGALYTALALVRLRRGELTEAAEAAEAAHQRFADLILDAQFVVPLATVDAELALAHGDPDRALELTRGVAEAYARHVWGRLVWPLMHVAARAASPRRPAWLTALIDELDDANQRYGPAQPNHAAQVRAALAGTRQAAPSDKRRPPSDLTARELEVLRLAAVGLNNPAIAAELVISRKTASVHVSHILDKLGAHTRGEAVAIALRRGTLTQADLEHLRPSEIRH
jgi:DNA-binding CsgD family transcriptional regulator